MDGTMLKRDVFYFSNIDEKFIINRLRFCKITEM